MTRTLYARESAFMRIVSTVVAVAFTLSLAGSGFASPVVAGSSETSSATQVEAPELGSPDPIEPAPAQPSDPVSEGGEGVAIAPDEGGAQENPAPPIGGAVKGGGAKTSASAAAAAASLPFASFNAVEWEAWRLSPHPGWVKANLGPYREGDWIPVRIVIDNTSGSTDVRVPAFHTAWDYLNTTKNAIAVDGARDFFFLAAPVLPGAQPYPAGAQDISAYFSEHVGPGTQYYNVVMATPTTDLVVPKGQYGAIYFQVHLALTQYWQTQSPARFGAKEYPGSSAQGRFLSWAGEGVGQRTISVPVGQAVTPTGRIDGIKFHDLNRDGVRQAGEPGLSGWTFTLAYLGEFPFTETTVSAAGGAFTFSTLPAGAYVLTETLTPPWQNSTPVPMSFTLERDEVRAIQVGNYLPDVTKTWSLVIDALPLGATAFARYSVNGGAPVTTPLTGSGPLEASVAVPYGATLTGIGFYAVIGGEEVLLGTLPDETLTADRTNRLVYDSSVSGIKFDVATGQGLSGWTIVLKRVAGSTETTYATAITGAGGIYRFEDVLPGTYALYEVQQPGWLMVSGPAGTFTVGNGQHVSGKDFGNLLIASSIELIKSGPALAHVGDVVTYVITVTNTGNYALTNVTVTDPLLGIAENIGTLAAGASHTITATRTVLAEDPDPLPNTATVFGTPILGPLVTDADDHVIDILKPAISLEKRAAPSIATSPALVTYVFVVTNTGEDPLFDVVLTDDKVSVPGSAIGTLEPGQSVTLSVDATLTETMTNVASVRGVDALGREVSDEDRATVTIHNPAIRIAKSASSAVVLPGGPVTYTYLVTNTGDIALFDVAVVDDKLGLVGTVPSLMPGASVTFTISTTLADDTANVGVVEGFYGVEDSDFFGSVSDASEAFVDVVSPGVAIIKDAAPETVLPGGAVTYTYTVVNTGDVALVDLVVTDDKLGEIGAVPVLPVGGSVTFTVSTVLTETTVNVGMVHGEDVHGHPVHDADEATVEVRSPAIAIVKTAAPMTALVGATVVYTYAVTNTGDVALHGIIVSDDVLGPIGAIAHLAPGETALLTATAIVTRDVTNVGTATGHFGDPESAFHGTVTASDDATVDVVAPAIRIVKTVSDASIVLGESVTYTYVVTNTGDVELLDVAITDDKLGDIGTVAVLAPGESATFTMGATPTEDTTNVATVVARDRSGHVVTATDDAFVEVGLPFTPPTAPDVSIDKSADRTDVEPGDRVTYTLTVRNIGDAEARRIVVTDDYDERYMSVVDAGGGEVSGGTITWLIEGPLAPGGAPVTITYTLKVADELPQGLSHIDNDVTVRTPGDDNDANDTDTWRVDVTEEEEPFLPFTGSELSLLLAVSGLAAALGAALRKRGTKRA